MEPCCACAGFRDFGVQLLWPDQQADYGISHNPAGKCNGTTSVSGSSKIFFFFC
jgi:hypothetical protein